MANCTTIDNSVPLYPSRDGTHPFAHLDAGTTVDTFGNAVAGPPGHGQIQQARTSKGNGWIYLSQLNCG